MIVRVQLSDKEWGESEVELNLSKYPTMRQEIALIAAIADVNPAEAFAQVCTLGIDVFIAEYGKEQLKQKKYELVQLVRAGPKG